jgi:type VI secretion system protein ImpL
MFASLNTIQLIIGTAVVLGAAAAGVWAWLRHRKKAGAKPQQQAGADEKAGSAPTGLGLPVLLRNTARQLRLAKNNGAIDAAALRDAPVVLIVGPSGAGKTSVLAESRLRPELQASQGCGEGESSGVWRVWLAERTVFLEVPESAAADSQTLRLLGRRLRPGFWSLLMRRMQAPRWILFCAEQSMLSQQLETQITQAVRVWNSRLCTLCDALAAQVPVYVLITKLDAIEGFGDFVGVLSEDESAQALGVTLPAFDPGSRQAYAEWIDKLIPESLAHILRSLRDGRVAVMSRERDQNKLARQFEFVRRFERLQHNIGSFLRELTMTSQVRIEPFLRGYYFTGIRRVVKRQNAEEPLVAKPPATPAGPERMATATTVLDPKKMAASFGPAAVPASAQQEITEWLFVPQLIRGVLLSDDPASRASGRNWRADVAWAWAGGVAAAIALLMLLGLTVSYARNRGLERALETGGAAVQANTPPDALTRLEMMRPAVQRLIGYYSDPPWNMGMGLNQVHKLAAPAQTIYCTAMREQVLEPVRRTIESRLSSLKNGGANPAEDYRLLKAYMMMTSNPERADPGFLTGVLVDTSQTSGQFSNRGPILSSQLQTYASLLPIAEGRQACLFSAPAGLIASAQEHLRSLNLKDRYQSLLQQAGSGLAPVDYNQLFPNDAVRNSHIVPGWFTRPGWDRMQGLLRNPERSLKADAWVLNQDEEFQPGELKTLADQLGERYRNDYIREWTEFLAAGQVSQYGNLKDAAAKLERMSGQRSVLLHLIGVASEHVAFDPMKLVFQPVLAVVAANGDFQAGEYLKQLDALKNRLSKASESTGAAHEQDVQEVRGAATAAQDAVDQIARGFKGDSDQLVKALLLRPITQIPSLLGKEGEQALNGAGRDFCREVEAVTHALPFGRSAQSASLDSVQRLLQPPAGRMWKFYELLQDSMSCGDSGCFIKEEPKHAVSKGFERYFNVLFHWSRLLFSSGEPIVRLQLEALKWNYLQKLDLSIDGATVSLSAGSPQRTAIAWDLRSSKRLRLTGTFEGEPTPQNLFQSEGQWALFEWLVNAESNTGGSPGFLWIPRSGTIKPTQMANTHTIEYRLLVQSADGAALDLRNLTLGPCAVPLAR